jgi:hypothetical protein
MNCGALGCLWATDLVVTNDSVTTALHCLSQLKFDSSIWPHGRFKNVPASRLNPTRRVAATIGRAPHVIEWQVASIRVVEINARRLRDARHGKV